MTHLRGPHATTAERYRVAWRNPAAYDEQRRDFPTEAAATRWAAAHVPEAWQRVVYAIRVEAAA